MAAALDHCGLHARLAPNRLAARDLAKGEDLTYAELDRLVARHVAALGKHGVTPGDRVAALARNSIGCVALHLACARMGAIYVPLNWRLSPAELAALLVDCEPKLLLGDAMLGTAGLAGLAIDGFADGAPQDSLIAGDNDRPSLILYTSGTSGRPKGALLSERNLERSAINFSLLGRVGAGSRFLCDAPMFHVIGLVANIRPALMHGGMLLVSDGFMPARTLERLGDAALDVTHYFCVPQMAAALRAEPGFDASRLRHLTAIFTGGAPNPPADILAWLKDGIAMVDGFGMSETGTAFGMPLDRGLIARRAGSVGLPAPGLMARLIGGDGHECAAGEIGELQLKGESVCRGYWRRPEETAFTEDGWFLTGDMARRDADGYFWIVGRRKDMFISGGENVYPAEIEAALAGHRAVAECAVVGVPDARWGEVGHLFYVGAIGAEELRIYLETRLARYKVPKYMTRVEKLPRTATGKVLKRELAAGQRPSDPSIPPRI